MDERLEPTRNSELRPWERVYGFVLKWAFFLIAVGIALAVLKQVSGILGNPSQRTVLIHALILPVAALASLILLFRFLMRTELLRRFMAVPLENRLLKFVILFAVYLAAWMLVGSIIDAFDLASGEAPLRSHRERIVTALLFSFFMALGNSGAFRMGRARKGSE